MLSSLCDLDTAAFRTVWRITITADQGLECMVARLTLILIKRHGRSDSSIAEAAGAYVGTMNARRAVWAGFMWIFSKAGSGLSMPGGLGQLV